jgi:hypothetical protein
MKLPKEVLQDWHVSYKSRRELHFAHTRHGIISILSTSQTFKIKHNGSEVKDLGKNKCFFTNTEALTYLINYIDDLNTGKKAKQFFNLSS